MTVEIRMYAACANHGPVHLCRDEIFVCGMKVCRNNVTVRLPAFERRVFLILATRQHAITSVAEIIDILWGDDADGGPNQAERRVQMAIVTLRDAGAALGFAIKCSYNRGFSLIPKAYKKEGVEA